MRKLKRTVWIMILIQVLLSAYLVYLDYNNSTFCLMGSGCETVKSSAYSTLLGIKLSIVGLTSFCILLAMFIFLEHHPHMPKIFMFSSFIGAGFAFYLIYTQLFIIKQICTFCFTIDIIMIIIAPLAIWHARRKFN